MGKPTTNTTITCRVAMPSCDHEILSVMSQLTDTKVKFVNDATLLDMQIKSTNAFTKKTTVSTAVSLLGCVRSLASPSSQRDASELYGSDAAASGQVESWIAASEQTLLAIPRGASNSSDNSNSVGELLLLETIQDFLGKIAAHLEQSSSNSSYLVGDAATAADVCVALPLVAIGLHHFKGDKLTWPDSATKWLETVLGQLEAVVDKPSAMAWGAWKQLSSKGGEAAPAPAATSAPAPAATPAADAPASAAPAAASGDNEILNLLKAQNVDFAVYDHPESKTAEALVENAPLPDGETHTKNLFLKDKKHGFVLITVATNSKTTTPVPTKQLGKMMGISGKTNFRMGDAQVMLDTLKSAPGCVGPLCAAIQAGDEKVTLVLDASLKNYSKIHSHPLRNDQSVSMTSDAFFACLKTSGVEPMILDFGSAAEAAPAAASGGGGGEKKQKPSQEPKKNKGEKKEKSAQALANKKTVKKGETLLALQWKKDENFAQWYTDVIVLSEMISYYDISGCYILRPWSYKIWELMQGWFNIEIGKLGVENCYFPLFVSQDRLEKEKDHVAGFAPEVAWVTRSGDGELAKPIAIRPTSETIMYPAFSDWIKSHRDLPLKLNQWSNVVRWEFKYPTPFLRSREFLWQEGHTVHSTYEEAQVMVRAALELYRRVYEELLAVPVVPGYKTEEEKFAGGHSTTTVEAYIRGSGRAIQGATSHNLGQNFGKMFDISFQDEQGKSQVAWQTSWGLTTRTIGVMIMVHGDDAGLVLPPRVAPIQVVIVPVISKKLPLETASPYCEEILKELEGLGIRAKYDDREMYNPGWKYNHWEQKGVPIRVEVGPRDIEQKQARCVLRYNGEKMDLSTDGLATFLKDKLEDVQEKMFQKAKEARDSHIATVTEWKDFVPNLELNNLIMTPWCGGEHRDWEEWVKKTSREESLKSRGDEEEEDEKTATSLAAKTLCIPFDQPELPEGTMCIASGLPATCWVLWGRSY